MFKKRLKNKFINSSRNNLSAVSFIIANPINSGFFGFGLISATQKNSSFSSNKLEFLERNIRWQLTERRFMKKRK